MLKRSPRPLLLILLAVFTAWSVLSAGAAPAWAQENVVRGILFYSPTCPHCHTVMTEDLPPLVDRYGDQFMLLYVDASTEFGGQLYRSTISALDIPPERQGVPTLIVDDTVLVGSLEIPQQLPLIIEAGLSAGGVPWPDIPGLEQVLANIEGEEPEASDPAGGEVVSPQGGSGAGDPAGGDEEAGNPDPVGSGPSTILERIGRDPIGNSLSVIVLLGMVVGLGLSARRWWRAESGGAARRRAARFSRWVPVLLLIGLAVAGYLAYVESTQSDALCGPVGDCNTVQSSSYAYIFGVPIGLLGVFGYLALFAAWAAGQRARPQLRGPATLVFALMALGGTLFSFYLTLLEPFVIGATCAWCLTSSVVMTALLLLSVRPARASYERLTAASGSDGR